VPGIPTPALGYVLLSAWVGMGLFSVLTAPLGARLAHAARPQTLTRGFARLLVVIGLHLVLGCTPPTGPPPPPPGRAPAGSA